MPKRSAGLLLFKHAGGELRVLLVHPGGPFWIKRDLGSWSIPKGEYADGEEPLTVALREFSEETGAAPPHGDLIALGEVRQAGGKIVTAWAVAGDLDPATISSNTFEAMWPPKSGRRQTYPEIDRAGWFDMAEARQKLIAGQLPLLERLENAVSVNGTKAESGGAKTL